MTKIGIASIDITPQHPVWLTGYGNRDHKSEGVYQPLTAGSNLYRRRHRRGPDPDRRPHRIRPCLRSGSKEPGLRNPPACYRVKSF